MTGDDPRVDDSLLTAFLQVSQYRHGGPVYASDLGDEPVASQ